MAERWSIQLPVYYSGFNYFTYTRKFRTLAIVPEVRYWFSDNNNGLYAGVHVGAAWYNVAFGGEKRYQDHNRHTPALGAGMNIGYRFHFTRNSRWLMELSLGVGVYELNYDIFRNKKNGLIIGQEKRTFFGLDQAAVSVAYRFDLPRKKGGGT